jgi:O-antigen ligase
MYTEYATEIELGQEYMYYEPAERTSDIQLPPVMNVLLLAIWIAISAIGFAVMFLGKNPVAGAVIVAVPTFIGMVIKPTFGLFIMMLVLPTGAGIGFKQAFSLDRGVGIALAVSFALNLLITRPRLRVGNRALWVMALYSLWIFLASLAGPYLNFELVRAFTQAQLLALILIVYWILETNGEKTFRWALRAYVIGTLATIVLAFVTGAAMRTLEDTPQSRYAATLGEAIDANMLAALTSMAFLAAIYLLVRDRSIFWRVLHLVAIVFLPIMLLRIGSRGAIVALAFAMLSPLLFVRQVLRKPALAALLLVIILLASIGAGLVVEKGAIEAPVSERLTDVGYAKESFRIRMDPIKRALTTVATRPTGTSYYGWFERTGTLIWPHNDFFLALGVYGIPGATLFAFFMVMLMLTIRRIPLGLEKIYVRAILIFLIVMGLTVSQLFHKYFWAFLAFVMAGERIVRFHMTTDNLEPTAEYEDDSLTQYESV